MKPSPANVIRLAAPKNVAEFARVMYAALREGDAKGLKSVVVAEPAGDGLALAIRIAAPTPQAER